MTLKALLFDVNGTLIDIETDEHLPEVYRVISRYLAYFGLNLPPDELKENYFRLEKEQLKASIEQFPEIDVTAIWQKIIDQAQGNRENLPLFLARLLRTLSQKRLQLYPRVTEVLDGFREQYRLGIVSDAQTAYAVGELSAVGLVKYFETIIISGDYGYRKPDSRMFNNAINQLGVEPGEAIFIGNDMYHDIFGAKQVGMRTIFFPTQYGGKEYPGTKPDYIIHSFAELPEAVEFLRNKML